MAELLNSSLRLRCLQNPALGSRWSSACACLLWELPEPGRVAASRDPVHPRAAHPARLSSVVRAGREAAGGCRAASSLATALELCGCDAGMFSPSPRTRSRTLADNVSRLSAFIIPQCPAHDRLSVNICPKQLKPHPYGPTSGRIYWSFTPILLVAVAVTGQSTGVGGFHGISGRVSRLKVMNSWPRSCPDTSVSKMGLRTWTDCFRSPLEGERRRARLGEVPRSARSLSRLPVRAP